VIVMGKRFPELLPEHEAFIAKQHIYFVGSAPLQGDGHINLSPKGYDSLRILSASEAAYADLTGSGNETSAHLMENGRITIMFAAFEGQPMILRLYGKGRVLLPESAEWEAYSTLFPSYPGLRQIIAVSIREVQSSCGFGVPFFDYAGERDTLIRWAETKGETIEDYWEDKNYASLDGLPTPLAVRPGLAVSGLFVQAQSADRDPMPPGQVATSRPYPYNEE
jgi:hypothetical protein